LNDLFLECDCHKEVIRVEKHEKEFWFSFWQCGFSCKEKYSFWQKLKLAFLVLKRGHGYSDMVILSKDQTNKLIEFLKEDK